MVMLNADHNPVTDALTGLWKSIGALNGTREQLQSSATCTSYQTIEQQADLILNIARSNGFLPPLDSDRAVTATVLGPDSNDASPDSVAIKLDRIASMLGSEQQRGMISSKISPHDSGLLLKTIAQLNSELGQLSTHAAADADHAENSSELAKLLAPTLVPQASPAGNDPRLAGTFIFDSQSVSQQSAPHTVVPPQFEDYYVIVGSIGEGGMGTVLRVRNEKLGRDEAAKMIQPKPGESESDQKVKLRRFHEEIRISSLLAPAGFIQTYDIFVTRDRKVGFTMELIEGGINLERIISAYTAAVHKAEHAGAGKVAGRAALEATVLGEEYVIPVAALSCPKPEENDGQDRAMLTHVLRVTPQAEEFSRSEKNSLTKALIEKLIHVCHNLQLMHDLGFIHRDLKPANILLDTQGKPRLADAGLAEEITRLPHVNPRISGTPQYMAPEQAIGDPIREGVHTDIYGIGAILYEIISGRTQIVLQPGERFTFASLDPIKNGEIPEAKRPGLSLFTFRDLEAICKKAMALEPENRYRSMAALADDLTAWVRGSEVAAYRQSATSGIARIYGMRRYISDNPIKSLGIGGGIASAITGGAFTLSAWGAKSEFDKLTSQAESTHNRYDPDALSNSLELHRRADTVIAPYSAPLSMLGFSEIRDNLNIRATIEREIQDRRASLSEFAAFKQDADSALRAASSDFSTYYATDRTAQLLDQAIHSYAPQIDSPQVAQEFLTSIEKLTLESREKKEMIHRAAQCLEAYAFKLPFHPDIGLKNPRDAERGKTLLRNARQLYEQLDIPLSTSEIAIELRFERDLQKVAEGRSSFRSQMLRTTEEVDPTQLDRPKSQVERLELLLEQTPAVSARDHYILGKIAFHDLADDGRALAHFNKALELAESPLESEENSLNSSIIFGAMYGKGLALLFLGRNEEANTAFSDARRAIQNLNLSESQGNDLFALTTSKIAQAYATGDVTKISPERIAAVNELYEQANRASPGNTAVLNSQGTFLAELQRMDEAEKVFSLLLEANPEYSYGMVQRGYARSRLGKVDDAVKDFLTAAGFEVADLTSDQLLDQLEQCVAGSPERLSLEGNLHRQWMYVVGLTECGNQTLASGNEAHAKRYFQQALNVLDLSVKWVEDRDGYGKSIIAPYALFQKLLERHPQELAGPFQRLNRFSQTQAFRSSY